MQSTEGPCISTEAATDDVPKQSRRKRLAVGTRGTTGSGGVQRPAQGAHTPSLLKKRPIDNLKQRLSSGRLRSALGARGGSSAKKRHAHTAPAAVAARRTPDALA